MKTYRNLWAQLCTFEHLEASYRLARKGKTLNPKVQEFDEHWRLNLCILLKELRDKTYRPRPLKKFVLRDPKTRVICVSDFRDRVVHHALVSVLQPIFEPRFIYDSYASRKGKGVLAALKRFDRFKRQVSRNGATVMPKRARNGNSVRGFCLKCDIRQYFENVDHNRLIQIIGARIKDELMIWLVRLILNNYRTKARGKGMPLGNWTSQFFANVYLNELDQFVKHRLKAKYYIRYVDDFVVLNRSRKKLKLWREKISEFIQEKLVLALHSTKSKIIQLRKGVDFLGFRVFYYNKLVRLRNLRKLWMNMGFLVKNYSAGVVGARDVLARLQNWNSYAMHANTYYLRERILKSVERKLVRS